MAAQGGVAPNPGGGPPGGSVTYSSFIEAGSGFRWDFDKTYRIGQFVTGDWWVVAPNGLKFTSILPATSTNTIPSTVPPGPYDGQTWIRNGTHVDPRAKSDIQGLDNSMYTHLTKSIGYQYQPVRNIAMNLATTVVTPGADGIASVISSRSMTTPANRPQLLKVKILTVLDQAPPADAFRPTYTVDVNGNHQEGWLRESDIAYNRVNVVDKLNQPLDPSGFPTQPPSIEACLDQVSETWYEAPGGVGFLKRYSRPLGSQLAYGYDLSNLMQVLMMRTLLSDKTVAEKKPLINQLIQLGFDRYNMGWQDPIVGSPSISNYSGHWDAEAGHGSGAKMAILYYAWLAGFPHRTEQMLGSNPLEGNYRDPGAGGTDQWFQHETQCFYVYAATTPGQTECVPGYGDTIAFPDGTPEWGVTHSKDLWLSLNPTADDPIWVEDDLSTGCPIMCNDSPCTGAPGTFTPNIRYRICCTGSGWSLQVLMSRIIRDNMSAGLTTWGSDYPFAKVVYDYLDRFHTEQFNHFYGILSIFHFDSTTPIGQNLARQAWLTWGAGTMFFDRP